MVSFLGMNTTNVKRKVVLNSVDVTTDKTYECISNRRIGVPLVRRTFILHVEFKISILIHIERKRQMWKNMWYNYMKRRR